MLSKQKTRLEMLAKRQGISDEERERYSDAICDRLLGIGLSPNAILSAYISMRGEANIHPALLSMHDRRVKLCIPSVTLPEKIMHFRSWVPRTEMRKGPHGAKEPATGDVVIPNVVWVPLLAFDRRGHRLGYGGGYFDATINHLRRANHQLQAIGIGYHFQELPEVPAEKHDMRLDAIVTDKEVIRF